MNKHITSLQHPLVKHLVKLRQNRSYRQEHSSVMIAGTKPVTELCQDAAAKTLLVMEGHDAPKAVEANECVFVSEAVMKKVTDMLHPEPLAAEIAIPAQHKLEGIKRLLVLDAVADPGNMGTLLRSALALGWEAVFILDNSVDPFNDKALRAARGATFRLPYRIGDDDACRQVLTHNKLQACVADVSGEAPEALAKEEGIALVLGNEAHGPESNYGAECRRVSIPMPGPMESLNVAVAGGILLYILGACHD